MCRVLKFVFVLFMIIPFDRSSLSLNFLGQRLVFEFLNDR